MAELDHLQLSEKDPEGMKDVLRLLISGAQENLGDLYVGTYLQGSQATGDFDEFSDLDFFVVVKSDVPKDIVDKLQKFHRSLFDEHPSHWAKHLEGSYIPLDALENLPPPRKKLLYLDHGHANFSMSDHDHYLAVLWVFREKGLILDGPDPKDFICLVPVESFREETRETMVTWANTILCNPEEMTEKWYQAFAVMNYCRLAATYVEGEVNSKQHGIRWAREAMDEEWHSLYDQANAQRAHPMEELLKRADEEVLQKTKDFVRYVVRTFVEEDFEK